MTEYIDIDTYQRENGKVRRVPEWGTMDAAYLGLGLRAAPSFPLQILGPWAEWVRQKAEGASAPVDYTAAALLAAGGAAIANVRWPVAGSGWSEPPVLWIAQAGGPGASKSPGTDPVLSLIRHAEDRLASDFEQVLRDYATAKQLSKVIREEWETDVRASRKSGEMAPDMPAAGVEPKQPVRPRIRVADATVEALGVLAASLPRGLLLVRDELTGWLGAFDKYGGGGSDRAFAIEMYGGRSYVVDRMRNPEPQVVPHLSVGVLGGIQPERIGAILSGPDDGLAARLLWAWPDRIPEFRLARTTPDDRPAEAAFLRLVEMRMGADNYGKPIPKKVRLTREAEDVLEEFSREIARQCQSATGMLASSMVKARGHVLRMATVLEFLWWSVVSDTSEPEEISDRAVAAAAGAMEVYFLPMLERVLGDAAIPEAERNARFLARTLKRQQSREFNARELGRTVGGCLRQTSNMDAACAALVEANIIRAARAPEGPGRKPKLFEVNPQMWRPQ